MLIIQFIPWLIAVVTLIAVISIVLVSWKNGISPMPTSRLVRQVVIQEVHRIPGYGDIIEAGSGWGRLEWTSSVIVRASVLRALRIRSFPSGSLKSCPA